MARTKTEYREYIASAEWQQRRKQFLVSHDRCAKCSMPRWLAAIAYDQDLHVHHLTYANVGREPDVDLQPLCRRCHDLETFGRSELTAPKSAKCKMCFEPHFDPYSDLCVRCEVPTVPEYAEECAGNIDWWAPSLNGSNFPQPEPLWRVVFAAVIGDKVRADAEARGVWTRPHLTAGLQESLEPFLKLLADEESGFLEAIKNYPAAKEVA
jgi:hypothetical protein